MALPALERGIQIIDYMIQHQTPCKYSELKAVIHGIGDASLNRLLKSLMEIECIQKRVDGSYELCQRVVDWGEQLCGERNRTTIIQNVVRTLSKQVDESVAFVELINGKLSVVAAEQCRGSIWIVTPESSFEFDAEHAGVASIIDSLPRAEVDILLQSNCGLTAFDITDRLSLWKQRGYYVDRNNQARRGISRCALPIISDSLIGSLFICLPTDQFDVDPSRYVNGLTKAKALLMSQL